MALGMRVRTARCLPAFHDLFGGCPGFRCHSRFPEADSQVSRRRFGLRNHDQRAAPRRRSVSTRRRRRQARPSENCGPARPRPGRPRPLEPAPIESSKALSPPRAPPALTTALSMNIVGPPAQRLAHPPIARRPLEPAEPRVHVVEEHHAVASGQHPAGDAADRTQIRSLPGRTAGRDIVTDRDDPEAVRRHIPDVFGGARRSCRSLGTQPGAKVPGSMLPAALFTMLFRAAHAQEPHLCAGPRFAFHPWLNFLASLARRDGE